MVSTPKAPDPQATAQAQAGMNRDTAITQSQLNMVNQQGPYGSLTYNQTGTSKFKDSNGNWIETPTYTATTSLSPEQQAILDQTQKANLNLGTIANERSAFLKDYLAQPFDVNASTEAKINELGSSRLDPRFAREQEALRTQLINSGIRPGSAAYSAAMNDFGQTKNDAYNQLALTGRQQAFQEASYERAQPLNEISALLSGAQVTQPQFVSTPQSNVAGVDYTGLVNNQYNQQVASSNAAMGGLFGLLGTGLTAGIKYSDRRLKSSITRVGMLDNGLPVYLYEINGTIELGVMADEVEAVIPNAVHIAENGFKMVDYNAATRAA
ncbi:tail fiber domain-containing protein [Sinorhizobium medicae]